MKLKSVLRPKCKRSKTVKTHQKRVIAQLSEYSDHVTLEITGTTIVELTDELIRLGDGMKRKVAKMRKDVSHA